MLHSLPCRLFLLFIFLVGGLFQVSAQTNANLNWYFGSNQRDFRFVRPDYTTENVTLPNSLGIGGSAVATDPVTGVLLFYTDGVTVYDAFDNALSPNLNGNTTFNQGVAICTNPADSTEFFIFTNNGTTISRSVFDKTAYAPGAAPFPAPGQGNLSTPLNDNTGLPTGTLSEGMIIISNTTLDGFWLISYDEAITSYNITSIDNAGTINTVTTAIAGTPTSVANFSYNAFTNQIAVAPTNPLEEVAILNIDTSTGTLTFGSSIAGTAVSASTSNIYDTEWSSNGDILYLSGNFGGANDSLMQINFTDTPPTLRPVSGQLLSRSFGLQMGLDSAIYHLYEATTGQFRVGRINDPDSVVAQTLYDPRPLGNQDFAGKQFPAFLPNIDPMASVDFTFAGICANVPTFFFPEINPPSDSVVWDFGDGNVSRQLNGINTYTAAGQYSVIMATFLNGSVDSVTKTIDIIDFDIQISGFPESDTLCAEDFPKDYTATASGTNAGSVTFQWSNNDAPGATTTITEPGSYYVIATDANGCEAYAPLQVVEYRAIEQRAFIWYFGNNAGIDFNPLSDDPPGPAVAIPVNDPTIYNGGNQMQSSEGAAIYCDDNGNPIFYTNGEEVFDRSGTPAGSPFASSIGGDQTAAQSSFIVPFPGDATLYYIFLSKPTYSASGAFEYEFSYVIFDLKQRQGFGDLIRDINGDVVSTVLYNGNTERITGNNNWVIVHEFGNNNFRAYPITALGLGNPVISNVGTSHTSSSATAGQGYMKLSNGGQLAVALSISNSENFVELFQFDNATGRVTETVSLDFGSETGQVYGVEFSPDENKLFATLRNAGGGTKIFRWEIDTTTVVGEITDPSHIISSRGEIANETGVDMGAMQQGPDGQIYIAKDGAPNLAILASPDEIVDPTTPSTAGYNASGFSLAGGTTSTLGLPNFINQFSNAPPGLLLVVFNGCSGEQNDFSVFNPSSLERYRWRINDDTGTEVLRSAVTDDGDFNFTITTPGTYTAIVDIIPECSTFDVPVSSVQQNFTISPLPAFTIENPTDPTSCAVNDGSFDINITSTGTFIYGISGPVGVSPDTVTAPTVVNIPNLSAGGYTVTITNALTGCIETDAVALSDPALYDVFANTTRSDCEGNNGSIDVVVNGGTPGLTFTYIVRTQANSAVVTTGSSSTTPFSITVGIGTYVLELTDNSGCTTTRPDLTIAPPPLADLTIPDEVIVCDDQPALIIFSSTNALTVNVSGPSQPQFQNDNSADADTVIVTLPGMYTFVAEGDGINTCDNIDALEVIFNSPSDNPFDSRYVICPQDPSPENRTVTLPSPPTGFESVRWFESNGNEITGNLADYEFNAAGDSLIIRNNGIITAEMTNFFGCVTIAEINIFEDCKARINAPTAFSPNGDGRNDSFFVFPILVAEEDFEIFIFNRWGELIFTSNQLDFSWNGTYNNEDSRPLPGGTYAYRINFKSAAKPEEGIQEMRGGVTLIR